MPYIWVPKSQLNPNPNPKINSINQSSSSNPKFNSITQSNPNPKINSINQPSSSNPNPKPHKKKNKHRKKKSKNKNKNKNKPNWLELPEDIWFLILSKLYTCHVLENVQKVCTLFRKICVQPSMFRVIDMTLPDAEMDLDFDANIMTRFAVDRSKGQLVDIYVEFCCDDDTLMYIAERSKNLKHLRIGHHIPIYDETLIKAVRKLPMLEEVEIIISRYSSGTYEALGHLCPSLKSFSLNNVGSRHDQFILNKESLAIAKSMPNLRRLQLIGNSMSNTGLKAILDGCPLLESLDLRACFNIDLSGDLGKRCDKIKHFQHPNDSTADYSHQACTDDDDFHYRLGEEESDYDYYDYVSDECEMFGYLPGYIDYADLDMFHDYLDGFDGYDNFSIPNYFATGGVFPGYD